MIHLAKAVTEEKKEIIPTYRFPASGLHSIFSDGLPYVQETLGQSLLQIMFENKRRAIFFGYGLYFTQLTQCRQAKTPC